MDLRRRALRVGIVVRVGVGGAAAVIAGTVVVTLAEHVSRRRSLSEGRRRYLAVGAGALVLVVVGHGCGGLEIVGYVVGLCE